MHDSRDLFKLFLMHVFQLLKVLLDMGTDDGLSFSDAAGCSFLSSLVCKTKEVFWLVLEDGKVEVLMYLIEFTYLCGHTAGTCVRLCTWDSTPMT